MVFDGGLNPFLTGALCSCSAWATVWPLDVAKSQLQSGKYQQKSFLYLLGDVVKSGGLFRGIFPGLVRSALANGCSMVVYKHIENYLVDKI